VIEGLLGDSDNPKQDGGADGSGARLK